MPDYQKKNHFKPKAVPALGLIELLMMVAVGRPSLITSKMENKFQNDVLSLENISVELKSHI